MKEYSEWIENLARNKEKMVFVNSGPEHATIVFSTIFKYAKKELDIYAGKMNGGISNKSSYLENLRNFLQNKGKIRLLINEYDFNNNPDLFSLLSLYQFYDAEQVQIRTTKSVLISAGTKKPVHFTTADGEMYRLEEDIEKFNAKGSFNDPVTVSALKSIYNDLFHEGTNIKLN